MFTSFCRPGLLLLLACLLAGQACADAVADRLRQDLEPLLQPGTPLHLDRASLAPAVARFYADRHWAPVWDSGRYQALLQEIGGLDGDGLNPDDYDYARLREYAGGGSDPATAARREEVATRACILALAQLFRGKVDPASLDPRWNFTTRPLDPDAGLTLLRQAVENGQLAAVFHQARPTFPQYDVLRQALAALRRQPGDAGPSALPSGPTLKPGMSDARLPALRQRLQQAGLLASTPVAAPLQYDEAVVAAVRAFQQQALLEPDGNLGPATLRALNVTVAERIGQLRANLERLRWFGRQPAGDCVLVDIAGFHVYYLHDGKPLWQARVQVGKAYRETPVFQSTITRITLNPAWSVPPTILREDALPDIRRNPAYLEKNRLHVFDASGHRLDPATVDWNQPGRISLRQDAGAGSALGRIAIRFPNPYSVYMHDTPHRNLFDSARRTFSSGCIRVENVRELAVLLLHDPQQWSAAALDAAIASNTTRELTLARPLPVLIAYWTVHVAADGTVAYKPDVYGRDAGILRALDTPQRLPDPAP